MTRYYLFGSRLLTHVAFWAGYYLLFGFIWARDGNYVDAYFLEFILLPVRMLTVYATIYWLIPRFLKERIYREFIFGMILLLVTAGVAQRLFMYVVYEFFTGRENLATLQLCGSCAKYHPHQFEQCCLCSHLRSCTLGKRAHENQLLREKSVTESRQAKSHHGSRALCSSKAGNVFTSGAIITNR